MCMNDRNSLRYIRHRSLIDNVENISLLKEAELKSLQAKGYLQNWFPMSNGLGFVFDESSQKYVIE